MRVRVIVFGTFGIFATVMGIGLLFLPSLFGIGPAGELASGLAEMEQPTLLVFVGLLPGLYLLAAAYGGSRAPAGESGATQRFEQAISHPPETVTAQPQLLAAATIHGEIETAMETGDRRLEEVRDLLRETAASAYAEAADVSETRAAEIVERGRWTRDTTAAIFLADEDGPEPTLRARLRLWLTPERERRRRLDRTVQAIEGLQGES